MSKWMRVAAMTAMFLLAATAYPQEPSHPEESAHGAAHAAGPTPTELSQLCRIDIRGDKKEQWMRLPKAESSVTQHRVSIGGKTIDYTATAGTLIVRDDKDKPIAEHRLHRLHAPGGEGRRGTPDHLRLQRRTGLVLAVAAHGRAGTASRRHRRPRSDAPGALPLVDNEFGVLDKSDLVMIDPVGTGLSHAVGDHKDNEFWGVDPDIESISRFIAQYVSDNDRWTSPKYLLGESYGTTRAAAIVDYLRSTARSPSTA